MGRTRQRPDYSIEWLLNAGLEARDCVENPLDDDMRDFAQSLLLKLETELADRLAELRPARARLLDRLSDRRRGHPSM